MKNYVQYHFSDRRGSAGDVEAAGDADAAGAAQTAELEETAQYFYIYTNKNKPGILGSRIWLFEGVGRPRRYFLAEVFIADTFILAQDPDFFYQVGGHAGQAFDHPPLEVTDLPWFHELRRLQGNFAFGLNELDARFVKLLEQLVEGY